MTAFVGISTTDIVAPGDDFRIVIEAKTIDWNLLDTFKSFGASVTDFFNNMLAKTGVVYPVSPNPVVAGNLLTGEQRVYTLDVRISGVDVVAGNYSAPVTAADVVNRLNGISSGVSVVRFQAITDADLTDAASRDALTASQSARDLASNPLTSLFGSLGRYATLAVIAVAAYALIVVSKEFSRG